MSKKSGQYLRIYSNYQIMEKTLVIFKPSAVARGLVGDILKRFQQKGLIICGMK